MILVHSDFLKRFPISFSDKKLKTNFSLDSRLSLIWMILGWCLYLYRTDWTESPITCSCKLSLQVDSGIFGTTFTKNVLKMSQISLSSDTMWLLFTSVILLLLLILSDKRDFTFLQNCLLSVTFLRSRLLSLRLEGVETLKYRCVCRPPFGKV